MLSLRQIEDVCLVAQGHEQCRFLAEDMYGSFFCLKKTGKKDEINEEVDDFIDKATKRGIDPESMGLPIGDNCKGYIFLKHKTQGYDVK